MSKRKNDDVIPDDDDVTERNSHDKPRQQPAQKVYDFHKKTMEVYPERLLELNRQFLSSISSQITTEPYSVLVGNCLDYVRQYFIYEDDLLQYSPWLATRLKQSRSDIVKCLKETIDVYEALARHDFDQLFEKNTTEKSSTDRVTSNTSAQVPPSTFQFRPLPSTTSPPVSSSSSSSNSTTTTTPSFGIAKSTLPSDSTPSFSFAKSTATTTVTSDSTPSFSLAKPTATTTVTSDSTPSFSFAKSTATTTLPSDSAPSFSFAKSTTPATGTSDATPSFSFAKSTASTTVTSDSAPAFSFAKSTAPATATNDSTPSFSFGRPATTDSTASTGFNFKTPASTTASPETTVNTSPFSFSIPSKGFGTSTFSSPNFPAPASTEKSPISSASSISFAPPPKFSFAPAPAASGEQQQGTTEDNEDEPSEPPEPEKVEHESDAKLTYRCRMGVNKGGKLIKRGPVQVVLKEANEKHQLIVRSDDTLGRLYLNILWSKLIEMKKHSTKDFTFICKLNPAMPDIPEGEFVMILFRFDNETDRDDAYDKLHKERS